MKILWFLALLFPGVAYAEMVTVVGDPWCPYNCEPESQEPGFMIELAREIFKEKGITLQYRVLPWARAINEVRKGQYNATVGGYVEDTPDFIFPKHPMAQSVFGFYVTKDNPLRWHYTDINSLNNVSLGVIRDYSYGDAIDPYISKYKNDTSRLQFVSGDNALEQNVKKLRAGRLQVVVEDAAVMTRFLEASHQNGEIINVGHTDPENVYIAFSPKNPKSQAYADILSEGIARYGQSGRLKALKAKYAMEQ